MLTYLGLIIITVSWVMQLLSHGSSIKLSFITTYALGVSLLVVDGILTSRTTLAFLNIFTLITALAVYYKEKH